MEIDNILKDYLSNKNTDYAIMINGKWGSGKTYYWKENLSKLILQTVYEIKAAHQEKKGWSLSKKGNETEQTIFFEPIYVSLYGLSDINELDKRIFFELNPFWKRRGVKIFSNIGKLIVNKGISFFGIDKFENSEFVELIKDFDIGKNKVLCFDDLERLKPEIVNEIFGFINLFTEHDKIKVIILCDEAELSKKFKDYNKVKEKLIRFTYNFDPELEIIYPSFIDKYPLPYKEFLLQQKKFICGLYQKANHKNLRTLKFNLDIFEKVFTIIQDHSELEKYRDEILNRLLFFTSTYCIEYKIEHDLNKLSELSKISSDNFLNFSDADWDNILFSANKEKESEKEVKQKEYPQIFREKYLPYEKAHFDYYPSIAKFIHTGVLGEQELSEEANKVFNSLKGKEIARENQIMQKFQNIHILNDDELQPLLDELLDNVKNGKYHIATFPNIFLSLLKLEHFGTNNFKVDEHLIQMFSEGILKAKAHSEFIESFQYHIPIFEKRNEKYEVIKKTAIEANNSLKENLNKSNASELLEDLKRHQGQEAFNLLVNTKIQFEPIFSFIDPQDFFKLILNLPNKEKCFINDALYRRYTTDYATDTTKKEREFFIGLSELIKNHLSKTGTALISNDIIRIIGDNITRIINLRN
jgi:hypothetical protein